MTATEELRRLLDERGVEYKRTPWSCGTAVWWRDSSGTMWRAHDNEEDELLSFYAYNSVTPEQVVEATLGRGTCHDLAETPDYCDKTEFKCSECGYEYSAVGGFGCDYGDEPDFRFCPECGRKVVNA